MPGIVLIDNDPEELKDIQNAFFSAGIPCLPVQYMADSGVDLVNFSNLNPRVVITDINLLDHSPQNIMSHVGPISELLKKIVKNGPYILYFWSKLSDEVEQIMKLLDERFKNEIVMPMHYGRIEKSRFKGPENSENLKQFVQSIMGENLLFYAVFEWENRVARAAIETTETLYNLTKPASVLEGASFSKTHSDEFRKALALIGNETLGTKNAKEFPDEAIDAGLAPVFYDRLKAKVPYSDKWSRAISEIGTKVTVSSYIKAALNSFYHVEAVDSNFPKECRGVFVEIASGVLQTTKFQQKIGADLKTILQDEFISDVKLNKAGDKQRVISETKLGFIEMSAECDHAQKKTKLHRYALSALIPIEFEDLTKFNRGGDKVDKTAHAGIYRLPNIVLDGQVYILKISFKYQIGTKPVASISQQTYENKWFGLPRFRLKGQILSEISFLNAQYSSRPGIVRFE